MAVRNNVAEILPVLRMLYPRYSNKWLALKFSTTEKAISSIAKKHRLKKADDYRMPTNTWTDDQLDFLRDNFRTVSYPFIASHIGKNPNTVTGMAFKLGLRRTAEEQKVIDEKYNTGCFKKGSVPPNKGVKGISYEGMVATQFKKGQLPANTLADGVITIRNDNRGIPQKHIRVSLKKWEYLSRWTWVQHFGPVPKNHIVAFKDKDTLNCSLDNLELITRRENVLRNKNPAKMSATMKRLWAEGLMDNGTISLHDSYVAGLIAKGDKELKQDILQMPDLIELKRTSLKLNRAIKHESNRTA